MTDPYWHLNNFSFLIGIPWWMSDCKAHHVTHHEVLTIKRWCKFSLHRCFLIVCRKPVRERQFVCNSQVDCFDTFVFGSEIGLDFVWANFCLSVEGGILIVRPLSHFLNQGQLVEIDICCTLRVINIESNIDFWSSVEVVLADTDLSVALGLSKSHEATNFVCKVDREVFVRNCVHRSFDFEKTIWWQVLLGRLRLDGCQGCHQLVLYFEWSAWTRCHEKTRWQPVRQINFELMYVFSFLKALIKGLKKKSLIQNFFLKFSGLPVPVATLVYLLFEFTAFYSQDLNRDLYWRAVSGNV